MKQFAEGLGAVLDVAQRIALIAVLAIILLVPSWFPLLDRFVFETTVINVLGTQLRVVDTRGVQGLEVRDGKLLLGGQDISALTDRLAQAESEAGRLRGELARLGTELGDAATALQRTTLPRPVTPESDPAAERGRLAEEAARLQGVAEAAARDAAPPVPAPSAPAGLAASFGIVFSADRALPAAMREVERVRDAGDAQLSLWQRQGFWRGIAEFEARQAAQAALPAYRAASFRGDAYVVEFRTWCPNARNLPGQPEAPGVRLVDCGF